MLAKYLLANAGRSLPDAAHELGILDAAGHGEARHLVHLGQQFRGKAILHPLGVDHTRLTYRHNGSNRRLTDVHGDVIGAILR